MSFTDFPRFGLSNRGLSRPRYPQRLRRPSARQAGFSLVELLVTVVIMAEVLVGLLILFDSSSRLARSQTHLAEIQQSLRVGQNELVRFVRLAGIGGLPMSRLDADLIDLTDYDLPGAFPRGGIAISMVNNAAEGTIVTSVNSAATAPAGTDLVVPGSDILIVRGVFETPLYYFTPSVDISSWNDDGINDEVISIPDHVRIVGDEYQDYPQDLTPFSERLQAAISASQPVALILRDTLNPNAYAIMELDWASYSAPADAAPANCTNVPSTASFTPECVTVRLRFDETTEPGSSYGYLSLGTNLLADASTMTIDLSPSDDETVRFPNSIGSIGLLEEYRFFVRAEWEVPGDDTTRLTPVLSRASFLPGTDTQLDRVDVADNVIDLQIALGADADPTGNTGYGEIRDTGAQDEILFNAIADTVDSDYTQPRGDTDPMTDPSAAQSWFDLRPNALEFHFLRINTLVQGRFADLDHRAPDILQIEDYNRGADFDIDTRTYNYNEFHQYHRRWLQTVVELRNQQ